MPTPIAGLFEIILPGLRPDIKVGSHVSMDGDTYAVVASVSQLTNPPRDMPSYTKLVLKRLPGKPSSAIDLGPTTATNPMAPAQASTIPATPSGGFSMGSTVAAVFPDEDDPEPKVSSQGGGLKKFDPLW